MPPSSAPFVGVPAHPSFWRGLLLAIATAAAYAPSLGGAWVLDDHASVLENASIRALWPPGPLFSPPESAGVGGRPFANLTLALNHAISGPAPWSYHLGNVLLHVASVLCLFSVAHRTLIRVGMRGRLPFPAQPGALAIALLWALHPLGTAAVDYVAQRTEVLMAACLLASLHAFLHFATSGRKRWACGAIALCAAGMAAKETMVTAPLVILFFDRTFLAGSFGAALRQRPRFYTALAASWLVLAVVMIATPVTERGVGFGLGVSSLDYLRAQCLALPTYLARVFWPLLVFDYGWAAYGAPTAAVMAGALLCLGALAFALLLLRRHPPAGFAFATAALLLAPTSSVVPIIQQPIAESRAYLPLAAALAGGCAILATLLGRRIRLPLLIAAAAFAGLTTGRHRDYRSDLQLWTDTIAKRPDNARAYNELGAALLRRGDIPAAVPALQTALRLQPAYIDPHINLGLAFLRRGQFDAATSELERALTLQPASALARHNLAAVHNDRSVALLAAGQPSAALAAADSALSRRPDLAAAHYNRGNALFQLGRVDDAVAAFRETLRRDPRFAKAEHNLGVIALRAGRRDEAIARFEAALRIDPNYASARENLQRAQRLR